MTVITTSQDCPECIYCSVIENSKADIRVFCEFKEKQYVYGQRLVCEYKKAKDGKDVKNE